MILFFQQTRWSQVRYESKRFLSFVGLDIQKYEKNFFSSIRSSFFWEDFSAPICHVRRVLSFGFYSIFYYNYQVLALLLWNRTLRSFGREPVRRIEQRTEWKFFFFFSLFLFRLISFPLRRTTFLCRIARHKREEYACAPSFFFLPLCLSGVLLNNLTIFFFSLRTQMTGANTYATCFRSLAVYFSYSSQFFFRSIWSMNFSPHTHLFNVTDRHAFCLSSSSLSRYTIIDRQIIISKGNEELIQSICCLFVVASVERIEIEIICRRLDFEKERERKKLTEESLHSSHVQSF